MNAPTATNIQRLRQTNAATFSGLLQFLRNDVDRLTKSAMHLEEQPEALRPIRETVLEFRAIARELEWRLSLVGSPQPAALKEGPLMRSVRNHATAQRIAEHVDRTIGSLKEAESAATSTRKRFQDAVEDVFYDSSLANFLLTCVERQDKCVKQIQLATETVTVARG